MEINYTPERTLKVLVATDGSYDRKAIDQHIARVSKAFEDQFGIRLETVGYLPISWGDSGERDVDRMLYKLYARGSGCSFDIGIGYARLKPGVVSSWSGMLLEDGMELSTILGGVL